jgi:hypothetical protein
MATVTDRVLEQGKALVRAIEALETIEPTGPIESAMVWVLLQAYRRRLRGIVELAPDWVAPDCGPPRVSGGTIDAQSGQRSRSDCGGGAAVRAAV